MIRSLVTFLARMKGGGSKPPGAGRTEILMAGAGGFLALLTVSYLDSLLVKAVDLPLLIAPFGASAVLVFGAVRSPFAQPRNLVGGHVVSAVVGVTCATLIPDPLWLSIACATGLSIMLMHITKTLHPPGGATALIAIIGGDSIRNLGYLYPCIPCLAGSLILVLVALVVNNIPRNHRYPVYWF